MSDASWGVRISRETKEYVQQLIAESGLSSREFFEQLLAVWVANRADTSFSIQSEELNQFEQLIGQITGMFKHVLSRERSEIERLNNELNALQEALNKSRSEIETLTLEKENAVSKLKSQIEVLNEMLVRYQGYESANRELEKAVMDLTAKLEKTSSECDRLKAQMASMRDRHQREIEQLKKEASRELAISEERHNRLKEKEILKIRLDYEAKLEAINKEYAAIIRGQSRKNLHAT